jgi:Ca2+-binding RTX toxin-like protein
MKMLTLSIMCSVVVCILVLCPFSILSIYSASALNNNLTNMLSQPAIADISNKSNSDAARVLNTNENLIIVGTAGKNALRGSNGSDFISGLANADVINGGEGDDELDGGTGPDKEYGEGGNDVLFGGIGNDTLSGGPGNDDLIGGPGADIVEGGLGTDYFNCGTGIDKIIDFNASQGDIRSSNCDY